MDIAEVSTALTGDGTLVVVVHLRDVPETLEFNRRNVPQGAFEYNRETGVMGAGYSLSANHFVFCPSGDQSVHRPLGEVVQASSWQLDESGSAYLSGIRLAVSPEENTSTLVGDVPGIPSQSRLVIETYDHLTGSEQVACPVLSRSGGGE